MRALWLWIASSAEQLQSLAVDTFGTTALLKDELGQPRTPAKARRRIGSVLPTGAGISQFAASTPQTR